MNKRIFPLLKGFTLLELLVTIAMLAILVALAAPSFDGTIKRNQVQAEQRDFLKDMSFARSEAVSRNTFVSVCSSLDGEVCGGIDDWSSGWIIFIDNDSPTIGNGVKSANEEVLRSHLADSSLPKTFSSGSAQRSALTYNSRGYFSSVLPSGDANKASFVVCPQDADDLAARAVFIQATGRAFESTDSDDPPNGIHNIPSNDITVDISC